MSETHIYRSEGLRRRRARIRGVATVVVIVGGIALDRALTGGQGEAPAAARDTSSSSPAHSAPGEAGVTPASPGAECAGEELEVSRAAAGASPWPPVRARSRAMPPTITTTVATPRMRARRRRSPSLR